MFSVIVTNVTNVSLPSRFTKRRSCDTEAHNFGLACHPNAILFVLNAIHTETNIFIKRTQYSRLLRLVLYCGVRNLLQKAR
jgi:hypothetical protein